MLATPNPNEKGKRKYKTRLKGIQ